MRNSGHNGGRKGYEQELHTQLVLAKSEVIILQALDGKLKPTSGLVKLAQSLYLKGIPQQNNNTNTGNINLIWRIPDSDDNGNNDIQPQPEASTSAPKLG